LTDTIYIYVSIYIYICCGREGWMEEWISVFLTSWSSKDRLDPEEEEDEEEEEEEGAVAGALERVVEFILSPSLSTPISSSRILPLVIFSLLLLLLSTQLPLLLLLLLLLPPTTASLACKAEIKLSRSLCSLLNALSQKSSDVTIAGNSKSGHEITPLPLPELELPVPVLLTEPDPEVH
jgi:hypothetical protein